MYSVQSVSFVDGLAKTAQWYRSNVDYWPDIDTALLPHPGEARARIHSHPRYLFLCLFACVCILFLVIVVEVMLILVYSIAFLSSNIDLFTTICFISSII